MYEKKKKKTFFVLNKKLEVMHNLCFEVNYPFNVHSDTKTHKQTTAESH